MRCRRDLWLPDNGEPSGYHLYGSRDSLRDRQNGKEGAHRCDVGRGRLDLLSVVPRTNEGRVSM